MEIACVWNPVPNMAGIICMCSYYIDVVIVTLAGTYILPDLFASKHTHCNLHGSVCLALQDYLLDISIDFCYKWIVVVYSSISVVIVSNSFADFYYLRYSCLALGCTIGTFVIVIYKRHTLTTLRGKQTYYMEAVGNSDISRLTFYMYYTVIVWSIYIYFNSRMNIYDFIVWKFVLLWNKVLRYRLVSQPWGLSLHFDSYCIYVMTMTIDNAYIYFTS